MVASVALLTDELITAEYTVNYKRRIPRRSCR